VWRFTTVAPANNPPTAPTGPNPADGATGIAATSQVCWTASTDPDGDPVTYDVAFGTSNPPAPVATGQSATCYDPPGDLSASVAHYWKVTAKDNRGGSTPGALWTFTTAAAPNNPPNAPANPSPANGASGVALTAGLSWSGSDPENDPLSYEVRFGTINPPPVVVSSQSATTYDPPGNLAAHTTFYWQIVVKDAAHPTGTPGPVWSFTTANAAPTAPGGPTPATGATNVAASAQLCWTAATDPDGDAVTYDVAFGTANPPPAVTSGQSATCYDPPGDLAAHTTYYWKVTAKDAYDGGTPGPVWSFTTANAAPTAPGGPTPATGATNVAATTVLSWSAATDSDGDAVSYEVRFGTSNPPPQVVAGQTATSYDPPGNLAIYRLYYWQVVAKDAFGGNTPGPVWSFTTAGGGGAFPDVFYISPSANVTLGGIAAQGADVLRYTKSADSWQMFFDGSNHGLTKNISAFSITDDGSLLFVLVANQAIAGLGTATPYDVVKFTPANPSAVPLDVGTFSMFFQGQLRGLTAAGEKLDAIDLVGTRLLLSTGGAASVGLASGGLLKAADEDVFVFNVSTNQWESALLIDGSKVPGLGVEDINGLWDDPQSGDYYVTILGAFNLGGLKGTDKSIVKLSPNGGTTVFTPSLVTWLAAGAMFGGKLDGLELSR
jgi:hypothetical protein